MVLIKSRKSTRSFMTYIGARKRKRRETFVWGSVRGTSNEGVSPGKTAVPSVAGQISEKLEQELPSETIYATKRKAVTKDWVALRDDFYKNGIFLPHNPPTPLWKLHHQCDSQYVKDVVVDEKGRQHVRSMLFCKCEDEALTLLRFGLWKASPKFPRLAFQMEFLTWIRNLLMECQVSVKGFCESLKNKTNETCQIQDIYKILMTETMEEFRHLAYKMENLSHKVLSNDTDCAACFKMSTKVFSFDADFQLVRKASSGKTWHNIEHLDHFFLDQCKVDNFAASYTTEVSKPKAVKLVIVPIHMKSKCNCSNFQAGNAVRSKNKTSKLAETAVFGSTCCHGFPKYFFNLKHGERIAYPVYLMKKLVEEAEEGSNLHIMYDTACILHSHLKVLYSPRRTQGIGLTDGESIERLWSFLGTFVKITKEMTPKNRVDLLIDGLIHYGKKIQDKFEKFTLQEEYSINLEKLHLTRLENLVKKAEKKLPVLGT